MDGRRWAAVGLLTGGILCDIGIGNAALSGKLLFWTVWSPFLLLSTETLLRPNKPWLQRFSVFAILTALFTVLSQFVQQWAPLPRGKWEFPATALDWFLAWAFVVVASVAFCGVAGLLAVAWRRIRPAGKTSPQ